MPPKFIKQVLFYEVISSTTPEFRANAYVDITDYIDKKIECLTYHTTQSGKSYMQDHIIRSLAHTGISYRQDRSKTGWTG